MMTLTRWAWVLLGVLLLTNGAVATPPDAKAVGVNMGYHVSWSPQVLFVDIFQRARPWIAFPADDRGTWQVPNVDVPTDDRGWPRRVPFRADDGRSYAVRTLLMGDRVGQWPEGRYTLMFQGRGRMEIEQDGHAEVYTRGGRYRLNLRRDAWNVEIRIMTSDPGDPIRDIHLVMPGHERSYLDQPFYPETVERLGPMSVLRMMNLRQINGGEYLSDNGVAPTDPDYTVTWEGRVTPDHYTQGGPRGVASEYLLGLAEAADADPWLNVPHGATDDYIRGLCRVIRERVPAGRYVYLELSNEPWNFSEEYPQSRYYLNLGRRDRLGGHGEWEIGRRAYVRAAARMFTIARQQLADTDLHLVNVIGGFAGDVGHSRRILELLNDRRLNPSGIKADALGIAPYLANFANDLVASGEIDHIQPVEMVRRLERSLTENLPVFGENDTYPSMVSMVRAHHALARRHGVALVAYEGGQHLVDLGPAMHHETLNEKIAAANAHPDMYRLYRRMLDLWFREGGGVFCSFVYSSLTNEWGVFAHVAYLGQPIDQAPKYRALIDHAGQP